ncbi:MAG: nucleotidyltransferase domain-containing protein [Clostridia bacterium]|nr:nucleotidyltransferase domain-containing protein [Clostridia bacterium]
MCSQDEVRSIVAELCDRLRALFPRECFDVTLFGSYARREAEDGSDIDVLVLVDAPRQEIAQKHWQIGDAAADLLLEHGVVVSPIVENRDYFLRHADILPFYRNIRREGVRIVA